MRRERIMVFLDHELGLITNEQALAQQGWIYNRSRLRRGVLAAQRLETQLVVNPLGALLRGELE